MKRTGSILLALCMAATLAACGTQESAVSEAPVSSVMENEVVNAPETSADVEAEEIVDDTGLLYRNNPRENEEDWIEGELTAAAFLEFDQFATFTTAQNLYPAFVRGELNYTPFVIDYTERENLVDLGTFSTYYPVQGEYSDWNIFYEYVTSVFTPDYFEEINEFYDQPLFVEQDGKTYCRGGDPAGHTLYLYTTYSLVNATDSRIEINILGHYIAEPDGDYDGYMYEGLVRQEAFPVVMELQEGVWRFSQFATEM